MTMAREGFAQHVSPRWLQPPARAAAAAALRRDGLVVLRDLITPETLAFTRQRLAKIEADMPLTRPPDIPGRKFQHDEPFFAILHRIITPTLQAVVGDPIKASYSYLAVYQPGASLPRHIDREQCAWNVSIAFDCDPLIDTAAGSWPIFVEHAGRQHEIRAGLGDAVVYPGTRNPHWREPLPAAFTRYAVCFFHFVDADFSGPLI